jgi:hypothetical protein
MEYRMGSQVQHLLPAGKLFPDQFPNTISENTGRPSMDREFRELDACERGLLERLLEVDFQGRDELRAQLNSVVAKQIEQYGTLVLRCEFGPPAPSRYRLVAEGVYKDADGSSVAVMLHVGKDRLMNMLEILKYDGSPIIKPPSGRDLELLLPENPGKKPSKVENLEGFDQ